MDQALSVKRKAHSLPSLIALIKIPKFEKFVIPSLDAPNNKISNNFNRFWNCAYVSTQMKNDSENDFAENKKLL